MCYNEREKIVRATRSTQLNCLPLQFFFSHSFAFFFVLKKTFAEQQQQPGHKSTAKANVAVGKTLLVAQ